VVASSRESARGAGWLPPVGPALPVGSWPLLLARRFKPRAEPFKWISVDALSKSYNDVLSRFAGERIVHAQRQRWIELTRLSGLAERFPDRIVDRTDLAEPAFVVLGDPGEGDASQYCVATAVRALAPSRPTDFMVLCSDVIYPAGDVNDYADRFYVPYADYPGTVYALPGNHDWYDLLHGFMEHFCVARGVSGFPAVRGWRERIARLLWRRARPVDSKLIEPLRAASPPWRASPSRPAQPGPYFAIDAGPVRLVCVDTGISGELDAEQGEWLLRVSAGERPKVLLTGRPLVVDYTRRPGPIEGSALTVDDIVRDPAHRYVAAIGGDIHNYQRYPVDVAGRRIEYLVTGGAGAYMSATHGLDPNQPPRDLPAGVDFPVEDDIRLYPLRGDSLAFYARQVVPFLRRALTTTVAAAAGLAVMALWMWFFSEVAAVVMLVLAALPASLAAYLVRIGALRTLTLRGALRFGAVDPDVAAAYVAERYKMQVTRDEGHAVDVPADARRVLELVMPLRQRGPLIRFLSELFDSDYPPFFKHFLLARVTDNHLVIECRSVTGWADAEHNPPIEDRVHIPLTPGT
jgi:hypothetical protein